MRRTDVITVRVPTDEVVINRNEAAMRLKIARSYENETINLCYNELLKVLKYKYAYILSPVIIKSPEICDLGFGDIKSSDLVKNLDGCREAYVMGATTGIGVDRLLTRLSLTSQAKNFITDALSSAAAESLCDYADNMLRGSGKKPMRYSPGYGDMPLSCQPMVLEAISAADTLGITLNKSLLMSPVKSVTAVMGIYYDK